MSTTAPPKRLFSKEQRTFVLKLKRCSAGIGRKLVAEMWLYPDAKLSAAA
jgi:hypothetical protein